MKHLKILSAIAIASLLFVSCRSSKNKELTVPADASTVVRLNGSSINSKADWNDLLKADWFRREKQVSTDSFDKQIMEDPERSGVDLKSDFVYFTHKRDFVRYSVFEGQLKSSSDFEKMLQGQNPGKKVEDGGSYNYMLVDKSDFVSWTGSKFIYISNEPLMGGNNSVTVDSLKVYAASLFDLKKENSIESNDSYATLTKETGDIHFWSNTADVLSDFQFGPIPLIAASAMMQGSVTAGTINFENGKIVMHSKQYLNPTLSKLIQKYSARSLTADQLNHVAPTASIVIAMNYDPQLIQDFVKVSGTESTANKFFEQYHLTFDELLKATKGEILMTAAKLGPEVTAGDEEEGDDIFPFGGDLLFASSLNNDTSFKKGASIVKQVFPGAASSIQNNWFLLGNSPATINHFFLPNTNPVVFQKLGGYPIGVYVDIQKGLEQWNTHGLDSALLQQINLSKNFWRDIVSNGGEFKNGCINFETNVNLADQSTNSLKQLAKYSVQMSKLIKKDEYVGSKASLKIPFLAYNY
ncbi:MAG: DUF4836 family protein [Flavisolibacter sp.]